MATRIDRTVTRREAMAAVLGGAAAAAMGGGLMRADEPAAKESSFKIGCGTVIFRQHPLRVALERIRRAGYDYFETQATGPWCPHVDPVKDDPQAFRRLVGEMGFKGVTGLWSANGAILGDPKSVEGISQTMRWAKEAGIPVVHAGDGAKPADMSDEDAMKLLGERLAKILEVAEKCQVYLGIEPHGSFSLTSDGLSKIMGLSPSKWLGINYDTANVHRATYVETAAGSYSWKLFGKRQDEVATLKTIVDRVVHVHVKDIVGTSCVALGKGEVNIAGCLAVLREHGYRGALSLETEGELGLEESQQLIEVSRKYLQALLTR